MKSLFYQPLRVDAKDHEILFWSDTHFGHRCESWENPLWKQRGFSSISDHDEQLAWRWNQSATNKTIFFHLGDFLFGHNGEQRLLDYFAKLNFHTLYLLPGNHTAGWKQVFESLPPDENVLRLGDDKQVVFCPNYLEAYINGQAFVLSHFPILSFNGQASKGKTIHLYGHVHGSLNRADHPIGEIYSHARVQDVGVEECLWPTSYATIRETFREWVPTSFSHHNSETKNPL